jgi:hypothetical protein
MDEAAAILAVAIINSSEKLRQDFANQSVQSPAAGAEFLSPYLAAAYTIVAKMRL